MQLQRCNFDAITYAATRHAYDSVSTARSIDILRRDFRDEIRTYAAEHGTELCRNCVRRGRRLSDSVCVCACRTVAWRRFARWMSRLIVLQQIERSYHPAPYIRGTPAHLAQYRNQRIHCYGGNRAANVIVAHVTAVNRQSVRYLITNNACITQFRSAKCRGRYITVSTFRNFVRRINAGEQNNM